MMLFSESSEVDGLVMVVMVAERTSHAGRRRNGFSDFSTELQSKNLSLF